MEKNEEKNTTAGNGKTTNGQQSQQQKNNGNRNGPKSPPIMTNGHHHLHPQNSPRTALANSAHNSSPGTAGGGTVSGLDRSATKRRPMIKRVKEPEAAARFQYYPHKKTCKVYVRKLQK
jgi:hypothetical protein